MQDWPLPQEIQIFLVDWKYSPIIERLVEAVIGGDLRSQDNIPRKRQLTTLHSCNILHILKTLGNADSIKSTKYSKRSECQLICSELRGVIRSMPFASSSAARFIKSQRPFYVKTRQILEVPEFMRIISGFLWYLSHIGLRRCRIRSSMSAGGVYCGRQSTKLPFSDNP